MISLLRFACNTDLGPKTLVACSLNENFCIAKLYQTVRIMLAVQFYSPIADHPAVYLIKQSRI